MESTVSLTRRTLSFLTTCRCNPAHLINAVVQGQVQYWAGMGQVFRHTSTSTGKWISTAVFYGICEGVRNREFFGLLSELAWLR
jgi:hypothetical protein